MKLRHYPFFITGILLALIGCEPKRDLYPYLANPTVEFGVTNRGSAGSQDVYPAKNATSDSISVILVGKPAEEPITVEYEIIPYSNPSLASTQPKDYVITGATNQVTIPTGRNIGYIRLKANTITDSRNFATVVFKLKSANKATVSSYYNTLFYYINP